MGTPVYSVHAAPSGSGVTSAGSACTCTTKCLEVDVSKHAKHATASWMVRGARLCCMCRLAVCVYRSLGNEVNSHHRTVFVSIGRLEMKL